MNLLSKITFNGSLVDSSKLSNFSIALILSPVFFDISFMFKSIVGSFVKPNR